MNQSDRPLPNPPRSRFGRDSQEEAPAPGMISDRMALAAAEGRIEEFLQHEIPAGEHARTLAMMMMGMSGMLPMETPAGPPQAVATHMPSPVVSDAQTDDSPEVPPELLAAIQQGDVANLMGILRAEHAKRAGSGAASDELSQAPAAASAARPPVPAPEPAAAASGAGPAGIDTAIIDELLRISADNDVTVDWLMLRAVKLYVAEYQKTGRL